MRGGALTRRVQDVLRPCTNAVLRFFGVREHEHRPHAALQFDAGRARFVSLLDEFVRPLGPGAPLKSMSGDLLSDDAVRLCTLGTERYGDMFSTLIVQNKPWQAPARLLLREDEVASAAAAEKKRQAKVDAKREELRKGKGKGPDAAEEIVQLEEKVAALEAALAARGAGDEEEEEEEEDDDLAALAAEVFAPGDD